MPARPSAKPIRVAALAPALEFAIALLMIASDAFGVDDYVVMAIMLLLVTAAATIPFLPFE